MATRQISGDLRRLGIASGKVAPPDYRDYLASLIEVTHGSRYRFCKATGVDPAHLSRVLSGTTDLSVRLLQELLAGLGAVLTVTPTAEVRERASPQAAYAGLHAMLVDSEQAASHHRKSLRRRASHG